jgi:hypothetical protein
MKDGGKENEKAGDENRGFTEWPKKKKRPNVNWTTCSFLILILMPSLYSNLHVVQKGSPPCTY